MPNRRRRKLSTAMSAVAAVAVASPCAYFLVFDATSGGKAPEHHEFKQAATISDLPNELMGALSQGLSQFGINMPPVPALTGGAGAATPGVTSPGLTSPGLTTPGLGTPGLTNPGLTNPGLTPAASGLAPTAALPTTPGLPGGGLTTPGGGLTNPAAGLTPGLSPVGGPGEVPISTPAGLDPGADGTYPILGDPSTLGGGMPSGTGGGGSGGLVNDVMQVANQLGASQAIDLIKGMVMPAIMQQVQQGGGALPGAAGALPGAAGALPGALPGVAGALPGAAAAVPATPPV